MFATDRVLSLTIRVRYRQDVLALTVRVCYRQHVLSLTVRVRYRQNVPIEVGDDVCVLVLYIEQAL